MTEKRDRISAEAGRTSPRICVVKALRAECQVLIDKLRLQHDWVRFRFRGEMHFDHRALRRVRKFVKSWLSEVDALVVVRFGLDDVE